MTTLTLSKPQSRATARAWPLLLSGLSLFAALLLLALLSSIAFGAAQIDAATVWQAIVAFDSNDTNHLIIQTLRLSRAVTAALAVAGAVMQGLTRNPLADPGLLGVNAGAAFAVVAAVFFWRIQTLSTYALFAFAGAGVTAVAVYALGSVGRGGPTPLKLTIAGAAISALISALTTAILLFNQRTLEEVRFWLVGGVSGRDFGLVALLGGLAVAVLIYLLAWRTQGGAGDSPIRLILVGIGLTAVLSAAQAILLLRADIERVQRALYWLTGSVYARSWDHLAALLPWCLVLIPLALFSAQHLNALHLGEEVARGLGSAVQWQRGMLLLVVVGLTGAAISQVGAIGFVGLIAPHIARRLVGPAHEGSQPVAALIGGLLVLTSDFAGRTLFAPVEVPAGIIIALVGAPFFIYLLWQQRATL